MANVQIDERLLVSLMQWHLLGLQDPEREQRIRDGLQAKLDAISRRKLYTASRTAPTQEERERARLEYLEAVGIGEDYHWSQAYEERRQRGEEDT